MAYFSHWCILCSICLLFTTNQCSFITREKGSRAVISCAVPKEQNITWQVRGATDFITLTSCSYNGNTCVNYMPDWYHSMVEKRSKGVEASLVISRLRTNETEFRCFSNHTIRTIRFQVYAIPGNPICDPVKVVYVHSTKKDLFFKCKTSNAYPFIKAMLFIKGVLLNDSHSVISHCSKEKFDTVTSDTYVAICEWHISPEILKPQNYKYFVTVNPFGFNSSGINIPLVISGDYTLQLSIPTAVIDDTQCPVGPGVRNGKITKGSTASCRCMLASTEYPSAQAGWYTLNGNDSLGIDDIEDGSSTLVIRSHNQGQSYQCRVWSLLTNAPVMGPVYTPTFAAPSSDPEPISLRIELVAGIVAGTVALTAIIAVVVGKWRSHRRQAADVAYSRSCLDDGAVIYKPKRSED